MSYVYAHAYMCGVLWGTTRMLLDRLAVEADLSIASPFGSLGDRAFAKGLVFFAFTHGRSHLEVGIASLPILSLATPSVCHVSWFIEEAG